MDAEKDEKESYTAPSARAIATNVLRREERAAGVHPVVVLLVELAVVLRLDAVEDVAPVITIAERRRTGARRAQRWFHPLAAPVSFQVAGERFREYLTATSRA